MAAQWENRLGHKLQKHPFSLIPHDRCIYHVPLMLRDTHPQAYTPYEVSIGPMLKSRGSPNGAMKRTEKIKMAYCNAFFNRALRSSTVFSGRVREMEATIRNSYENPPMNHFLETVLIDSCFIIELFLRVYALSNGSTMEGDPLVGSRRENDIFIDLILLENQVPFSVLQVIYDAAALGPAPSLLELTCNYFRKWRPTHRKITRTPLHFTDLLRDFMLPTSLADPQHSRGDIVERVHTVSELWDAGVRFEVKLACSLVEMDFLNGRLRIPKIKLDEAAEVMFRNIVALEQCHYLSIPPECLVTDYLYLLHLLVQSEHDAQILIDHNIIVNWTGEISVVPRLLRELCSKVVMNRMSLRYVELCGQLNCFYDSWWAWVYKWVLKLWRLIKYAPWKIVSCAAAGVMLLFSYLQTKIAYKALEKNC